MNVFIYVKPNQNNTIYSLLEKEVKMEQGGNLSV